MRPFSRLNVHAAYATFGYSLLRIISGLELFSVIC